MNTEKQASTLIVQTGNQIRVSAIDIQMDRHLRIVNKAGLKSIVALGDVGINKNLREEGYVATLCGGFGDNPNIGFAGTQDLHVTRKQLEILKEAIELFLETH